MIRIVASVSRFTSGSQGGSGPSATQAQVKAIYAICDSQGLSRDRRSSIVYRPSSFGPPQPYQTARLKSTSRIF